MALTSMMALLYFEVDMVTSTDNFKQCINCKENIHKDAIKCTHCGSFQNWRHHLGISSSFLSIMVAFISVLTVFITVLSDSTIKNDSDINFSIVNWQSTFFNDAGRLSSVLIVEAFVTNSGKKPGAIKAFSIKAAGEKQFKYMRSGPIEHTSVYSHNEIKGQIVEPGKTLLLKYHLKTLLDIKVFEDMYSNSTLMLKAVNFSGREQDIVIEIKQSTPIFFQ